MTEAADHPRDALHDLVDGRLDADSLAPIEAHVRSCASCRRELDVLRATKRKAASAFSSAGGPEVLEALERRVLAALDDEDRARAHADAKATRPLVPRLEDSVRPGILAFLLGHPARSLAAVGAVALVVAAALFMLSRPVDLPTSVAQGYDEARSGRLDLARKTSDPRALAAYFAENLTFRPGVFDLGTMHYRLVGGAVHRVGGRPSSLAVYEGPDGRTVTCDMYEGRLSELPPPTAVIENRGVVFRVYQRRGRTLVFWQDGGVVCVLASDKPSSEVIPLAFAEASKA